MSDPVIAHVPSFNETMVKACESIVKAYQSTTIDKAKATLGLFEAIDIGGADNDADRTARTNSFNTFFGQLDESDAKRRGAHDRGARAGATATVEGTSGDAPPAGGEVGDEGDPGSETEATDEADAPRAAKRKRTESNDSSTPKIPLEEALLPFMPGNRVAIRLQGTDSLEATLLLKENYLRDVSLVKQRILCRPDCPEVPENIWSHVIANKFVDLDHIFTSIFSVDGDTKDTFHLGDVELSTASSKPTKKIANQGDWISCWTRYMDAVLYVYPHRSVELRAYQSYLNDTFVGLKPSLGGQVIRFDRAVRAVVARGNRGTLSDFSKFQYLQTMYLHPGGAAAAGVLAPTEGGRGRGRSNEICKRFNDGRCPDRNCRFKHACLSCASTSHGQVDCTGGKSSAADAKRK